MQRLDWLGREIMKLTEEHGIELTQAAICRCGQEYVDEYALEAHWVDNVLGVLMDKFQIKEFDQRWEAVLGCNQPECIEAGWDRSLHEHKMEGIRLELREKEPRPIEDGRL